MTKHKNSAGNKRKEESEREKTEAETLAPIRRRKKILTDIYQGEKKKKGPKEGERDGENDTNICCATQDSAKKQNKPTTKKQ